MLCRDPSIGRAEARKSGEQHCRLQRPCVGRRGRQGHGAGAGLTAWFLLMDLSTPGKLIQPSQPVLSGFGPLRPISCLPGHRPHERTAASDRLLDRRAPQRLVCSAAVCARRASTLCGTPACP